VRLALPEKSLEIKVFYLTVQIISGCLL
jgi:hypothetical protein